SPLRREKYAREGTSSAGLGQACFRCSPTRVLRYEQEKLKAVKVHQEKVQQEKLKAVKARLNFEETSQHSKSGTPNRRRDLKRRLGSRRARGMSGNPEPRRGHSESPRKRDPERKTMFKRLERGVFHRLGDKEKNPFTSRIRYFDFPKTRMPGHIKKYDIIEDLEDHLKIFQAATKTERWAMPTWCHMFNATLTKNAKVWEEFVRRYKLKCSDVKGALKCMKISRFMHGITNLELIKRLHDKISKSVDEMMRVTTTFLRGEVAASNREQKKSFPSWKEQEARQKQNFKKGGEEDGTEGPMIIEAKIEGHFVHRMYVDGGSSSEILYEHCFNRFRLEEMRNIQRSMDEFHGCGTVTLQSSRIIPLECIVVSGPGVPQPVINQVAEEKIQVAIYPEYPEQTIVIGSTLTKEGLKELYGLLRRNLDIFAWRPVDMTGVLWHIAEHMLKMDWKVDYLCGYPFKYFLDVYKGYHQMKMAEEDDKGTFLGFKVDVDGLRGPKVNYTPLEKLIFALVSASKRLKRYFQAHTIVVITDQPIKQMLSNPKVAERLLKWRFELEEHDIHYRPRMSVKGQILVDFFVEHPKDDPLDTPMEDKEELSEPWVLFTNGSSCIDGSGAGLLITNLEGMEFTYALRFRFNATNNEAKYEALIAGLRIAEQMGVKIFKQM
nr:reverse transcriptase domain-containing protein [Tanacetum cinerariifolium]